MNSYLYHFNNENGEQITTRLYWANSVEDANKLAHKETLKWSICLYPMVYSINGKRAQGPFPINDV
jgi:hypothetical protein